MCLTKLFGKPLSPSRIPWPPRNSGSAVEYEVSHFNAHCKTDNYCRVLACPQLTALFLHKRPNEKIHNATLSSHSYIPEWSYFLIQDFNMLQKFAHTGSIEAQSGKGLFEAGAPAARKPANVKIIPLNRLAAYIGINHHQFIFN